MPGFCLSMQHYRKFLLYMVPRKFGKEYVVGVFVSPARGMGGEGLAFPLRAFGGGRGRGAEGLAFFLCVLLVSCVSLILPVAVV